MTIQCKALDILAVAHQSCVEPIYVADNGYTDDRRLVVWSVGDTEVIETNGNSVWPDDDGFADALAKCA